MSLNVQKWSASNNLFIWLLYLRRCLGRNPWPQCRRTQTTASALGSSRSSDWCNDILQQRDALFTHQPLHRNADSHREKRNRYLPGRMAHTGMMRWPIHLPLSSYTAILRDASVGRTTWNRRLIKIRLFDWWFSVCSHILFWRPSALHPTLDWRHCFGMSWSWTLSVWCPPVGHTFPPPRKHRLSYQTGTERRWSVKDTGISSTLWGRSQTFNLNLMDSADNHDALKWTLCKPAGFKRVFRFSQCSTVILYMQRLQQMPCLGVIFLITETQTSVKNICQVHWLLLYRKKNTGN